MPARTSSALLGLVLATTAAVVPARDVPARDVPTQPTPGSVTIAVVGAIGSGCPQGSVYSWPGQDGASLNAYFSGLFVQVGSTASPIDGRRSCALTIAVHTPPLFTYHLTQADLTGYAELADGASATVRLAYGFQGEARTTFPAHTFSGPLRTDWTVTDQPDITTQVVAPCEPVRNLIVTIDVRATLGTSDPHSTNFLALDGVDIAPSVFHFGFTPCT